MYRLFISPEKQVTGSYLLETLNSIFQDPELGRPVIGSVKCTDHINIWDVTLFVAEVICGSDAMDELLEQIHHSNMSVIPLNDTTIAEVWKVPEGLGDYLRFYEEERVIHREKLMRKWEISEPNETPSWIRWSNEEEMEYQARVRLMKITSEKVGYFEPIDPDHFTDDTLTFLENLGAKLPPPEFYKRLAEDQAEETAHLLAWASFGSKNWECPFRGACGSSWATTFEWNDVSVNQDIVYPWTIPKEDLAFYRETLQKEIVNAAEYFLE
jgi:hypothetical protein